MASFKTADGKTIKDGAEVELVFRYDGGEHSDRDRYAYVTHRGTVRRFEQVERVYDDEGIAIGKTNEEHWELLTGDPNSPAIGFRPENVSVRDS